MKLTVLDRLLVLSILPTEHDITTLRLMRDLQRNLGFTDEENTALKFEKLENGLKWDTEAVGERDIEIGLSAHASVLKAFKEIDKKKKMTYQLLAVYEKFEEASNG